MTWLLLLPVALAAGMAAPTQFAINSQLRQVVGGPVLVAALSFLVGTVVLFVTTAVVRRSVPELGPIMNAPWWMWLGGLLGAFFVCASIVLTPRLGAATTVGLFLAGQVIASIAIDHFGLLGVHCWCRYRTEVLGLQSGSSFLISLIAERAIRGRSILLRITFALR